MKTNTPKQTVEAMRKKIEEISDKHRRWLNGATNNCLNVVEFENAIMALLNPVGKEPRSYFDLSDKEKKAFVQKVAEESSAEQIRKYGAPSPKEAPKGEGKYPASKTSLLPEAKVNEPLPPDKEWEEEFSKLKGKTVIVKHVASLYGVNIKSEKTEQLDAVVYDEAIAFIKALLLSKDQEADRRVAEAIRMIESLMDDEKGEIGDEIIDAKLITTKNWEALKKKLSLSKEGKVNSL